jgi:hypothetical protein
MSPVAEADGHDAPGLVAQVVPGIAAEIDDLIVGLEDSVREPVVAHELPDVFDGVQFGSLWRQRQNGDVFGEPEFCRRMPAGLIEDQDRVCAGIDGGADLRQMGVHRVRVAPWQDETDALAFLRTDGPEDVGPLGALILRRAGPCAAFGPAARDLVLLADPGLVLEPELDLYAWSEALADRFDLGREVFLNASTANSFCA